MSRIKHHSAQFPWPTHFPLDQKPTGTITSSYQDFRVDEQLAYSPKGSGSHLFISFEKIGLTTFDAIKSIALALKIPRRSIGAAGLKDSHGVTRQTISVENVTTEQVAGLHIPRIKILSATPHTNKLRVGHVRANSFTVKLRNMDSPSVATVHNTMHTLIERGVPNYFGPQRFGARGDTWKIGKALLDTNFLEAANLISGGPGPQDSGAVLHARTLFANKDYNAAASKWPRGYSISAALCRFMASAKGDAKKAVTRMGRDRLVFYIFAYQSWLFNHVVAARIQTLDQIDDGDIAYKHDNGAAFLVQDHTIERDRIDRFEISPTGPLFGPRMLQPLGEPAALEDRVIAEKDGAISQLMHNRWIRRGGSRRALRFQPQEVNIDEQEDDIGKHTNIQFTLPTGSYATVLLREIYNETHTSTNLIGTEAMHK
jgi:tRNA pseudouridine13 synthase